MKKKTIRTADSRGARDRNQTLPEGWKDRSGSKDEIKRHEVREDGMNMPTASMRNIIIKEDETIAEGGTDKSEDNLIGGSGD